MNEDEVIEMRGVRGFIEAIDAWGDRHMLPCFLTWAGTHLPRFSNWFWRDA